MLACSLGTNEKEKHHSLPQRGSCSHKEIFYFSLLPQHKEKLQQPCCIGWGGGGGGGVQRFGHRSKDLSFTESSGPKHFSPLSLHHLLAHCAAFMLPEPQSQPSEGRPWQGVNIALTRQSWTEMWTLIVFGRTRVLRGHTAGAERKQTRKRDGAAGVGWGGRVHSLYNSTIFLCEESSTTLLLNTHLKQINGFLLLCQPV